MTYSIVREVVVVMSQWWSDIKVNLYARPDVIDKLGKEKAVLVMNHKFQLDWIATWLMARNFGSLQVKLQFCHSYFVDGMLNHLNIMGHVQLQPIGCHN